MNQYIITPQELKDKLDAGDSIELIDVRTPDKHASYNIGGKLIPLEELPQRLAEIDRTKPIVTYCTMGGRSMRALQYLISEGFSDIKSLDGGMTRWQDEIK
jgi:adenylyltransferase/sulfurtransferase